MKARILIATLAMATALLAQPPGGGFRRNASPGGTPVNPVDREVKMLTRMLDLSAAQQTTITGILGADTTKLQGLQDTLKTKRANLAAAIKLNSDLTGPVAALSLTQSSIEGIRAGEAAAIYQTLTPEQKTKLGDGLGPLYGGGGPGPGFGRMGGPPPQQ
jgi:Spy/CpxP family protein refolding chaperone